LLTIDWVTWKCAAPDFWERGLRSGGGVISERLAGVSADALAELNFSAETGARFFPIWKPAQTRIVRPIVALTNHNKPRLWLTVEFDRGVLCLFLFLPLAMRFVANVFCRRPNCTHSDGKVVASFIRLMFAGEKETHHRSGSLPWVGCEFAAPGK